MTKKEYKDIREFIIADLSDHCSKDSIALLKMRYETGIDSVRTLEKIVTCAQLIKVLENRCILSEMKLKEWINLVEVCKRPTLVEEIRSYQLQCNLVDRHDSDLDLAIRYIHDKIGKNWRNLYRALYCKSSMPVIEGMIDDMAGRNDSVHEKCLMILRMWKKELGEDANVKSLTDSLKKCGLISLSAAVKNRRYLNP